MLGLHKATWVGAAAIGIASGCFAAVLAPVDGNVAAALKGRLPKTEVARIDCNTIGGLCEVTSGKSVFYVDRSARYLIVGHVYDMETRQDLTSARLLAINPAALLGGASQRAEEDDAGEPTALASAQAGRVVVHDYPIDRSAPAAGSGAGSDGKVSLAALPTGGAIQWGRGSTKVTIFTDFHCGYCRALTNTLETMDVTVVERPISVLGTRGLTDRVYCARDRVRALHAAYAGEEPAAPPSKCDTSGLDANEGFARANGFSGTPVIVRSDGAVLHGFRPKEFLVAWLKGAKS